MINLDFQSLSLFFPAKTIKNQSFHSQQNIATQKKVLFEFNKKICFHRSTNFAVLSNPYEIYENIHFFYEIVEMWK